MCYKFKNLCIMSKIKYEINQKERKELQDELTSLEKTIDSYWDDYEMDLITAEGIDGVIVEIPIEYIERIYNQYVERDEEIKFKLELEEVESAGFNTSSTYQVKTNTIYKPKKK